MVTHSVTNKEKEVCREVELLNRTCLDLVAQIERLEMENARLKRKIMEGEEAQGSSGILDHKR